MADNLTPAERRLRASLAAHTSWANTEDRTARTEPMRRAFRASFADKVDPDHLLPEDEREARGESLRQAHYQRLSLAAAKARRERAERANR